eukprot:g12178.t1
MAAPGSSPSAAPGCDEIRWNNIGWTVELAPPKTRNAAPISKTILSGCSGYCKRGRLLAVMGQSGSGKTSLLNVLAGRIQQTIGELTLDGEKLDSAVLDEYRDICGYVQQKDVFYATNKVSEHLNFIGRMLSVEEKQMTRVVDALDLNDCKDNIIGSEEQIIGA